MKMRNVLELRTYLKQNALSPEKFSLQCGISNMTVRRWLKNKDSETLPSKYWPIFDHAFSKVPAELSASSFAFADGFDELEKHVYALGELPQNINTLEREYAEKSKDPNIAAGLLQKIRLLFSSVGSDKLSPYQRTLIGGAIVYFLSPMDLVPDLTPVIGYLDDYAVATMVLNSVFQPFRKTNPNES